MGQFLLARSNLSAPPFFQHTRNPSPPLKNPPELVVVTYTAPQYFRMGVLPVFRNRLRERLKWDEFHPRWCHTQFRRKMGETVI